LQSSDNFLDTPRGPLAEHVVDTEGYSSQVDLAVRAEVLVVAAAVSVEVSVAALAAAVQAGVGNA